MVPDEYFLPILLDDGVAAVDRRGSELGHRCHRRWRPPDRIRQLVPEVQDQLGLGPPDSRMLLRTWKKKYCLKLF